jgi:predicted transcriptional regulator
LAEETPVTDRRLAWRDADQDPTGVFITAAGREAIGVGGGGADTNTDPAVAAAVESVGVTGAGAFVTALQQPRAGSKNDLVLEMLRRDGGATITELFAATNWLPHTTRGMLTGLRKKGNPITRGKRDDVTCYTIEVPA